MKDTPVIFQAPMVYAIMREIEQPYTGKTNTRRMKWNEPKWPIPVGKPFAERRPTTWVKTMPGDRLWVRESYYAWGEWIQDNEAGNSGRWTFRHDDGTKPSFGGYPITDSIAPRKREAGRMAYWRRPAIHMPRAHSRITLVVESVKQERLQHISEADARSEGVRCSPGPLRRWWVDGMAQQTGTIEGAVAAFRLLWTDINGADAWDTNPEVIAIEFKPHLANIDAMPKPEAA